MKSIPGNFLIFTLLLAPLASGDPVSDLKGRAEQGELAAQLELAKIYLQGEGTPKNVDEAVKWFSQAATQGSSEAQMKLGTMYIAGNGVRRNSNEAAKWFMMSAESGNAAAQTQVARMCMSGAGVLKSDVEAYKWATLSAAQGDTAAKRVLEFLGMKLTPEQIADGQKRSREFLEAKQSQDLTQEAVDPVDPLPPLEPEILIE